MVDRYYVRAHEYLSSALEHADKTVCLLDTAAAAAAAAAASSSMVKESLVGRFVRETNSECETKCSTCQVLGRPDRF